MSKRETCPACHQVIRYPRLGVFMSKQRARIVDFINEGGALGVSQGEIAVKFDLTLDAVRTHVYQINHLLKKSDYQINPYYVGSLGNRYPAYQTNGYHIARAQGGADVRMGGYVLAKREPRM